jgi:hypothetical protein
MKKKESKKFSLEKFEVAKFKSLSKIKGGTGDAQVLTGDDDGSITDILDMISTKLCDPKDIPNG